MSRHPDGQIRHYPVRTVLRAQCDVAALGQIEALEIGSHATCLINRLFPRPGLDVVIPATHRLGEVHAIRGILLPVVCTFQ